MRRQAGDSFSNAVIKRILQVLIENGQLKKTQLAGKAGINYAMCLKYINFLSRLQWIELTKDANGAQLVTISMDGIANLKRLEGENKSTLTLSAPSLASARTGPARSTLRQAETIKSISHKGKRVVIVDDDENALVTYTSFLEHSDFKVMAFSNSRKAFEFLTLHPNSYDLIILDIRMPGMSGLRLFQGIKASNQNAKVIFVSSLDAAQELLDIYPDIKQEHFLSKPVSRTKLLGTVSTALS
jgi:CheY-like chemotaxis protein/predicted transcriptional regulator